VVHNLDEIISYWLIFQSIKGGQMNTQIDFRRSKRFEHKSTALLEDEFGGYFSYGQIINYSEAGVCLWSDVAFKPGVKIKISLDNRLFKAAPKSYRGIINWCKELGDGGSQYLYGVGLKYD
jgi:PilZ domain